MMNNFSSHPLLLFCIHVLSNVTLSHPFTFIYFLNSAIFFLTCDTPTPTTLVLTNELTKNEIKEKERKLLRLLWWWW